jgi:hypothetical protein
MRTRGIGFRIIASSLALISSEGPPVVSRREDIRRSLGPRRASAVAGAVPGGTVRIGALDQRAPCTSRDARLR